MKNKIFYAKVISLVYTSLLSLNLLATSTDVKPINGPSQIETPTQAGTSNGGGGGAYVLPNGQVVTLPEFGVLIQDKLSIPNTTGKIFPALPKPYIVTADVEKSYNWLRRKLTSSVPILHNSFPTHVIPGNKYTLISKLDVAPTVYEQIKTEYKAVLEAYGYKLEDDKFILPAYSEKGTTYILPDFERLNPMQKAKYLLHEYTMRSVSSNRRELLERALKIDSIVEEIAFSKEEKKMDRFTLLKRLIKMDLIKQQEVFFEIMINLVKELGGSMDLKSLIEDSVRFIPYSNEFIPAITQIIDPRFIQAMQTNHHLKANYAEMLEGVAFEVQYSAATTPELEKKYCNDKSNRDQWRIVPGPVNNRNYEAADYYMDESGAFVQPPNLPVFRVILIKCDYSFPFTSIEARTISPIQYGPFIKSFYQKK